jgi:uncharacterized protein
MKRIFTISILTFGILIASFSQDKASDLKHLFTLMNTDKMIDAMINSMLPILEKQAKEQITGADAQEKYTKYVDFLMNETRELSKKVINVELVQIYDKYFTQQEIKDLIGFYESPTGQKMLNITPEITKDLMNAMSEKYIPDFQAKLIKKLEELK